MKRTPGMPRVAAPHGVTARLIAPTWPCDTRHGVVSGSALVTLTETVSPRAARSVGPRYPPLYPQVGVALPRNAVLPAAARNWNTRRASPSTRDGASGGTASRVAEPDLPDGAHIGLGPQHPGRPASPATTAGTPMSAALSNPRRPMPRQLFPAARRSTPGAMSLADVIRRSSDACAVPSVRRMPYRPPQTTSRSCDACHLLGLGPQTSNRKRSDQPTIQACWFRRIP